MEFTELVELYKHLEDHAGDYKYPHQISNHFQKIRDIKREGAQTAEAEKAQWEVDCFSFVMKDGELKPHFSGTDDKGRPWEYPDKTKLSDEALDYIENRLKSTPNPILRARYAHILWCSKRKHGKYAKAATDAYLELVRFYEEKDKTDSQGHHGLDVLHSIEETSILAFKVSYRIDDVRSEMSRLVRQFNSESSSAFVMRAQLAKHMLEGKDNFPPECFDGFPEVYRDLAEKLFKEGKFHNAIDIYKAGEKIDNRLSLKTHDWLRSIAESYEGLMNQRQGSDPAAISFCQGALEYYNKIKDEKKVKELEKRYGELIGKQQFKTFSQDIELSEYRKKCEEIAGKITDESPESIISTLMMDKGIIPTYKSMEARAKEIGEQTVLLNIMPISITDGHGHTAEHFVTDDERKYFKILEQYAVEVNFGRQFLIYDIFLQAIKKDKINIYTVMDFFEKHSWYGKNITKKMPQGKTETYNWLNMLAPSLNEYFNQVNAHFLEPEYMPNFVLAMDSLILKIEGLVRDICTFSGIATFYPTKDKHGRSIVREKDINWLLREEPIKKLFDEDDLLFFKFVLVEKAGLNLRHKIAHCLIDYAEYNIAYMHLLLLVLFRLGKYDFVKPYEAIEEKVVDSE